MKTRAAQDPESIFLIDEFHDKCQMLHRKVSVW